MSGFILIFFDDAVPDPSSQVVVDGQPKTSSKPGSAKSDRSKPVVGQGRDSDEIHTGCNFEQAVTSSRKSLKTAADYRPHCQHKEGCAASGLQHCYSCQKLIAAGAVA